MLIDWLKFIIALLLLLPPVALLHGKHTRYRALMRDWHGYWGRTFSDGSHAIDLVRAALGAWLMAVALTQAPGARGIAAYLPFITQAAVFAVAAALQTLVCKEPEAANAPFAFSAGLIIGFLPPLLPGFGPLLTVAFALLLAIVAASGANSPAAYFPVLSVAVVGLGLVFTQQKLKMALGVVAIASALPWLLTLLFPRHLVTSYRSRASVSSKPKS